MVGVSMCGWVKGSSQRTLGVSAGTFSGRLDARLGTADLYMHERRSPRTRRCTRVRGLRSAKAGGVVLSHRASPAVPSALWGLTAVFGMGTGVTPTLKPPTNMSVASLRRRRSLHCGGTRCDVPSRYVSSQNLRSAQVPTPPFGGVDVHSASSCAYSCIHTEAPPTVEGVGHQRSLAGRVVVTLHGTRPYGTRWSWGERRFSRSRERLRTEVTWQDQMFVDSRTDTVTTAVRGWTTLRT